MSKQIVVLWVGIGALVLAMLFPPVMTGKRVYFYDYQSLKERVPVNLVMGYGLVDESFSGFRFLARTRESDLTPQRKYDDEIHTLSTRTYMSYEILALELAIIVLITAGTFYTVRRQE